MILVILLTPSQVEISGGIFSPSIFTFIFNAILEKDYSLRVLRPLVISLPMWIILISIFIYSKKKFFQQKDSQG